MPVPLNWAIIFLVKPLPTLGLRPRRHSEQQHLFQAPHTGSVHMTQDICGKQVLPTSPKACKYKKSKADVSIPANISCSPSVVLRGVRRCKARCWTLIHCAS